MCSCVNTSLLQRAVGLRIYTHFLVSNSSELSKDNVALSSTRSPTKSLKVVHCLNINTRSRWACFLPSWLRCWCQRTWRSFDPPRKELPALDFYCIVIAQTLLLEMARLCLENDVILQHTVHGIVVLRCYSGRGSEGGSVFCTSSIDKCMLLQILLTGLCVAQKTKETTTTRSRGACMHDIRPIKIKHSR